MTLKIDYELQELLLAPVFVALQPDLCLVPIIGWAIRGLITFGYQGASDLTHLGICFFLLRLVLKLLLNRNFLLK
jgi:hypothetical protein